MSLLTTLRCFFRSWINIFHKFQGRSGSDTLTHSAFGYYGNLKAKTNEIQNTWQRPGDGVRFLMNSVAAGEAGLYPVTTRCFCLAALFVSIAELTTVLVGVFWPLQRN